MDLQLASEECDGCEIDGGGSLVEDAYGKGDLRGWKVCCNRIQLQIDVHALTLILTLIDVHNILYK